VGRRKLGRGRFSRGLASTLMGHVDLSGISYHLADGRVLLDDV
jgi:hypothetical protein